MNCPHCGADLPNDAHFCIECGVPVAPAATEATVKLPVPEAALACRACGAPNPPDAIFCVRCGHRHGAQPFRQLDIPAPLAPPAPAARRRRNRRQLSYLIPSLFLIGLGLLILLGKSFLWPGLLILSAALAFLHEALNGRPIRGLIALLWALGLLVALMLPRLFFPAILLTIGATILLNSARRGRARRW